MCFYNIYVYLSYTWINQLVRLLSFFILIAFFASGCHLNEKMSNQNLAHLYQTGAPTINYNLEPYSDSLAVYITFFKAPDFNMNSFLSNISISYFTLNGYNSNESSSAGPLSLAETRETEDAFWVKIVLSPAALKQKLIILELEDLKTGSIELIDIVIPPDLNHTPSPTAWRITNGNKVPGYVISSSDSIIFLKNRNDNSVKIYAKLLRSFSNPAKPPMLNWERESDTSILDSSFSFSFEDTLSFLNEGSYLFSYDSTFKNSCVLMVKNNRFPMITRPEQMIEPLIYITSPDEFYTLTTSSNIKLSLDEFWLKTGGNKEHSRRAIKSFYEKVEFANKAFSSWKEGWKTDKGMIYIIFGPPHEVYKYNDREEWIYNNLFNVPLVFIFKPHKDHPIPNYYELERKSDYELYWKRITEKIRNGVILK